jgi:hypothetical protein
MIAIERRRNMKAESCRACGKFCEAGDGFLYRDTHTHRRNRYTGRFLWFVKCVDCHEGNKTKGIVAAEKYAAAHASDPVVRPWSLSQVRKWSVERIEHKDDVAIRIESATFAGIISYRDRINSSFRAPTGYAMEQYEFAGKPLSRNAADELTNRVLPIINAVNSEERASGEIAAAKLVAAGAVVSKHCCGFCWNVEFKGGRFTLWGCVNGNNKMSGIINGKWVETTAENLIRVE